MEVEERIEQIQKEVEKAIKPQVMFVTCTAAETVVTAIMHDVGKVEDGHTSLSGLHKAAASRES